jgi:berberine-like enzyme
VRDVGTVAMWGLMPMPLPVIQSAFDALYPPGDQWYWRGEYFDRISDEAIDLHVEHGARLPSMNSTMHLYPVDGAAARPANDDTAWAYRDAKWAGVFAGVDPDPSNAEAVSSWAREYSDVLRPHSMGGGYVNFMMDEGQDRVRATYRGNYDRLTQVKRAYDPDNACHVNQNIAPAG